MAAQAAHLVDAVVPDVPIRQFVLSFPFELSALVLTKPAARRIEATSTQSPSARCGGRLRVRAVVTGPDAAQRIHDAVARKNARAPPTLAA